MILLLGGTSETAGIATAFAEAEFDVLVSTATDVCLDVGDHDRIARRSGALDGSGMEQLVRSKGIKAIVDATHPYAVEAHEVAQTVSAKLSLPYVRWNRPESVVQDGSIVYVDSHEKAGELACSFGKPVFITTGAKNLKPYVRASSTAQIELVVRVLPHPDSIQAALEAGCKESKIITGRGPFSVEDNLAVIREFAIGVLVTKDSGEAGGVPEKIEAAKKAGCHIVMVSRPKETSDQTFERISDLVEAVRNLLDKSTSYMKKTGKA